MKFLADECCDALVVAGLCADGHDVGYVKETTPGATDDTVLQAAFAEQRLLLTEDKDFGELAVRLRVPTHGIVLLRIDPADSQAKLQRLRETVRQESDRLVGHFVVVEHTRTRFRPLPA